HTHDRRGGRDGGSGELRERPARTRRPDHGVRASRVPGRGPACPPARSHRGGARVAACGDREGARTGCARSAPGALPRACARDERRVLGRDRARRGRRSGEADSRDVRLRAGRRLVCAHPRAEARRQAHPSGRALHRSGPAVSHVTLVTLAEAAAEADALAQAGDQRALAQFRSQWDEEIEAGARDADYRVRAQAYRAIAQFRFRQKLELLRRGLEDESPAARGSALIALESLSRDHPGDVNAFRPLLHELAAHDPNAAVRRLAVICLKNGTPQRGTLQILEGIAESDEDDLELRKTARAVHASLKKKSVAR